MRMISEKTGTSILKVRDHVNGPMKVRGPYDEGVQFRAVGTDGRTYMVVLSVKEIENLSELAKLKA